MAVTNAKSKAATEHAEELQLAKLVNQEASLSSEIELQVIRNEVIEYTYSWNGEQVRMQKLHVLLQSKIPDQYCLGVAKVRKKDKSERKKIAERWQKGTAWRFKALILVNDNLRTFTHHAALQLICAGQRLRRCYRARPSHKYQGQ